MNRRVLAPALLISAPLLFSILFSRIYSDRFCLFFPSPSVDDEGYFDHLNVWFGDPVYQRERAPEVRVSPALLDRRLRRANERSRNLAQGGVSRNHRGIGAAVLWAPTYLVFKFGEPVLRPLLQLQDFDPLERLRLGAATGNYFIAVGIGLLAYAILKRYVSQWTSLFFSLLVLFGGMLPYYLFRRPLLSHAAESLFFLWIVYEIERIQSEPAANGSYIRAGLACAGLLSTRMHHAPVVAAMTGLAAWGLKKNWKKIFMWLGAMTMGLVPQLYVNWRNFGSLLVPMNDLVTFATPIYFLQIGWVQLDRAVRMFIGSDWGLFWMFPWIFFAFGVSRAQLQRCRHLSKAWLIPPALSILTVLNYKAHGASYGYRYANLFLISLTFLAAMGFDRIAAFPQWRKWAIAGLAGCGMISLVHFVAFESDARDLTLRVDSVLFEGPHRQEWLLYDNVDWINESYTKNVYALFAQPKRLIETFGAAPLPLFLAAKVPPLLGRSAPPAVTGYIERHHIRWSRYGRYVLLLALMHGLLLAGILRLIPFDRFSKTRRQGR